MRVIGPADIAGKNGPDIGKLWSFVPAAVRNEVRIAPVTYRPFAGDWRGTPSGNWDEVAMACELVNVVGKYPTLGPPGDVVAWLRDKAANREWMTNEFGSWIYLMFHVEPTLVQLACARYLAESHSDPWAEIADALNSWLRAMVGWVTLTGCWGGGQTWTERVAKDGPGARLLTGAGGMNKRHGGASYSVLAGKRSWNYSGEWTRSLHAPIYLSWFGLGERRTGGDILPLEIPAAIRSRFGYDLTVLTAQEYALVAAAITNDISALKWALHELIRDWMPHERITIVRTERGVGQVVHAAGKSSTATIYYSGWLSDGVTHAAGCDSGLRGAHGEAIEPGMASFDIAARTGYCVRTEGEPRPIVPFELPPGKLVAVLELGGGSATVEHWFINGVEQPPPSPDPPPGPVPPPTPRPPRKRGGFWKGIMWGD